MAIIALAGNTIGCCIGAGSFENIGSSFTSAKQSVGTLAQGLSALKSKIDSARAAASVDTSHTQAQNAEKREETKKSSLTTGYDKLETLISDVNTVDSKSSHKIRERKNDFYARYSYLKPDCEKTKKELKAEKRAERWQKVKNFCGKVWEGIKSIGEWCKEHWVAIVTAIVVIAVAIVAAVFLGPAAVAAICSLIAFICSSADTVAQLITGKDVYTLLSESGHPILAEIFGGVKWGSLAAATILNFAQLFTQIHKVGLPTFMKTLTGGEGFKGLLKTAWNGIKSDCGAIFGKGHSMGQRVKAVFNIVVLNQDGEFSFKNSINAYRNGGEKIITAVSNLGYDDDNNFIAKSEYARDALSKRGYSPDSIATKKSSTLFDQSVDYDWVHYGAEKVGEVDVMKLYKEGKIPYNPDGTVNNGQLRKLLQTGIDNPDGRTLHEIYQMKKGKITIMSVDQTIHSRRVFAHNGGTSNAANIINSINSGTFAQYEKKLVIEGLNRIVPDIVWNIGNQFYSWAL